MYMYTCLIAESTFCTATKLYRRNGNDCADLRDSMKPAPRNPLVSVPLPRNGWWNVGSGAMCWGKSLLYAPQNSYLTQERLVENTSISLLLPPQNKGEKALTPENSYRDPTRATIDREFEGYRFGHGGENYITTNQVIWRPIQRDLVCYWLFGINSSPALPNPHLCRLLWGMYIHIPDS